MSSIQYPGRESKLLEFKSKLPAFTSLIKTSIAFANAAGGRIIIGVDDDSHKIIGISDVARNRLYDDFPNSLYDSVQPSLIPQIYEQNFGAQSVLVIEIPASPRKPYFLKQKGLAKGTYIRIGSSTRKANQDYIEDLVREAQRISYDEEIIHVPIETLSSELLKQFYGTKVMKKRLLADKIVAPKPANNSLLAPTIAGLLLFSEAPENYIPEAVIKITQFEGTAGRDIIRRADISGTIEQQSVETIRLLESWLATNYKLQRTKLVGRMPIPSDALRETIINALLHRKYSIPGAIKIALYDNRVEIFSPGGFPGLVDINNLGDGTTYLRNPNLARLAYRMSLIETRGTGIRLMIESCAKAGIRKPVFHEEGDFVKVVFYFEPDKAQYITEEVAILAMLKMHKNVSATQIAEYLKISHNTAIRKLNVLISEKKITKTGKGPAVRYHLN